MMSILMLKFKKYMY